MNATLEREDAGVSSDVIEEEEKGHLSPTRSKRKPKVCPARCAAPSK